VLSPIISGFKLHFS